MAGRRTRAARRGRTRLAVLIVGIALLVPRIADATADARVYVWRDAAGAVRFSTVAPPTRR